MDKLNYGLALGNDGRFQVADTVHDIGIRDDFSRQLSEPFVYFVAPADYVDRYLMLHLLVGEDYLSARRIRMHGRPDAIKDAILMYHGKPTRPRKKTPTWARTHEDDTDWFNNPAYRDPFSRE
jgi:hypothetical protein